MGVDFNGFFLTQRAKKNKEFDLNLCVENNFSFK